MTQRLIEVDSYIKENTLQSKVWDEADDEIKIKAVNNAERILLKLLPIQFQSGVPIDDLSEQIIWMLKIDDTFQRAELGASAISIDGLSINIDSLDRSIAPYIIRSYKISTFKGRLRRVGSYLVLKEDTFRFGSR